MAQPTVSDEADAAIRAEDIPRARAPEVRRARLEGLTFDDLALDEAARARVEHFRDAVLAANAAGIRGGDLADLWALEGPAEAARQDRGTSDR